MDIVLLSVLILLFLVGVHAYLYRRVVKDVTRAGGWPARVGAALVWTSAGLLVAGLLVLFPAEAPWDAARRLSGLAESWLSPLLYLTAALLLGEVVRPLLRRSLARRGVRARRTPATDEGRTPKEVSDAVPDPTRRLFVARVVAGGAVTLGLTAGGVRRLTEEVPVQDEDARSVEIAMPFTGRWRVENSPARRVPSHGTNLFGGRYAIDFTAVDERHRSADGVSWRTFLGTEPPEMFLGFGRPVLAPVDGTVVAVHDGEPDHEARRSQPALASYALSQGSRLRRGVPGVAGNHIVIALPDGGVHLALAHVRRGSLRVAAGQKVTTGQHIADCGNSGNSTQPHVHMQAMDSADLSVARGVPMLFRRYREWTSGPGKPRIAHLAVPGERAVVEPLHDR